MKTLLLCVLLLIAPASRTPVAAADGKVFLTVEEALALAFPGCEIERRTVYLTDEQKERAAKLARTEVDRAIVHPYVATRKGVPVGTAYFDTHQVRTKRETVMFTVDGKGRIGRIELLAFAEPVEYVPRGNWYAQFVGKRLRDGLNLKRDIKGVTGATLTARATTAAARRVLAVHQVLYGEEPEEDGRDEARERP